MQNIGVSRRHSHPQIEVSSAHDNSEVYDTSIVGMLLPFPCSMCVEPRTRCDAEGASRYHPGRRVVNGAFPPPCHPPSGEEAEGRCDRGARELPRHHEGQQPLRTARHTLASTAPLLNLHELHEWRQLRAKAIGRRSIIFQHPSGQGQTTFLRIIEVLSRPTGRVWRRLLYVKSRDGC